MNVRTSVSLTCLIATLGSIGVSAQVRSAIQFRDSTGATPTARIGWQGGEGGQLFIDAPNDGVGSGITSKEGSLTVRNAVTAGSFSGNGAGLVVPQSSVSGLVDSLGRKADTNYVKSKVVTPTIISIAGLVDSLGRKADTNYVKSKVVSPTIISIAGLADSLGRKADTNYVKAKVAAITVSGSSIQDGTVDSIDIAANAVRGSHIKDGTIGNADIAANAIDSTRLGNGSVSGNEIADGAIFNNDINPSAAIAGTKVNPDFGSQTLRTRGLVYFLDSLRMGPLNGTNTLTFDHMTAGGGWGAVLTVGVESHGQPSVISYGDVNVRCNDSTISNGLNVWDNNTGNNIRLRHTGVQGVLSTSGGNLSLRPASHIVAVIGSVSATEGSCCVSDGRYKKCVLNIENALQMVKELQGVYYEWDQLAYPGANLPLGRQIGFIAQDVEKIVPEVVATDAAGSKALYYDKLTALLVEAVKEQQKQIELLEARNQALEKRLNQVESAISR